MGVESGSDMESGKILDAQEVIAQKFIAEFKDVLSETDDLTVQFVLLGDELPEESAVVAFEAIMKTYREAWRALKDFENDRRDHDKLKAAREAKAGLEGMVAEMEPLLDLPSDEE